MATVLEELLISIGFDVDQKGLKKAQDSIKGDLQSSGKEAKAQGKKNKGLKEQEKALDGINKQKDELWKQSGSNDDDEARRENRQENVNKLLNDAKGLLGSVTVGWAAAGSVAAGYTLKMAKLNDTTAKFSRGFGVSSDKLQGWEHAARISGSSSEALRGTVASLTGIIGAAETFGGYNQGLAMLGLNFRTTGGEAKDALQLLDEIGEKTKQFSPSKRVAILATLGVDQSLINLLSEDRFSRQALIKEGLDIGVDSAEQLSASEKFYDESTKLMGDIRSDTKEIRNLFTVIATGAIKGARFVAGKETFAAPAKTAEEVAFEIAQARGAGQETLRIGVMNVNVDSLEDINSVESFQKNMGDLIRNSKNNADKSGDL